MEFRISEPLYTARLIGDGVVVELGLTPDAEEWTSLVWSVHFDQDWRGFPSQIRDSMLGSVDLKPLESLLDNSQDSEFWFGGCCTDMKIYLGKWGSRTGFIVELLYNPGDYGRWPDRAELASNLLDGRSPITNHQVGFVCEFEQLDRFYKDMRNAATKLHIG